MECHNYHKKIPGYISGSLPVDQIIDIEHHLEHCSHCRQEVGSFRELDLLIDAAVVEVPLVNLTETIVKTVKVRRHKKLSSVLRDVVAAAAAAIIIFWFSGPLLNTVTAPDYSEEVTSVSTTVGGVFKAYLNLSESAVNGLTQSVERLNLKIKSKEMK